MLNDDLESTTNSDTYKKTSYLFIPIVWILVFLTILLLWANHIFKEDFPFSPLFWKTLSHPDSVEISEFWMDSATSIIDSIKKCN